MLAVSLVFASPGTAQPLFALQSSAEQCRIEVRSGPTLGALEDSASLTNPVGFDVAPAPASNGWVVGDPDQEYVLSYDAEGQFQGRFLPWGEGPGEVRLPNRTELDPSDSLWIASGLGRAVVVGADGGSRTIVSPEQYGVDGHTPAGFPFATMGWLQVDDQDQVVPGSTYLGAIVMDRDGNALWTLGPVRQSPSAQSRPPQRSTHPFGLAAMGDSVFWGTAHRRVDPDAWVARWTAEGAETFVRAEEVADLLGHRTSELRSPFTGYVIGMIPDGSGGAWGLARSPAVTERQEEEIRREHVDSLEGEPRATSVVTYHPSVANRVHATVLFYLSSDAELTDAVLLEGMPRGFADRNRYYTLEETDEGVLQVKIWEFSRSCDES
ncbi:MAG: hypothetical protein EA351_00945 [Gemmatimonadales bacterium]|nr:MAG: hypothetical protein EA351_00945 [Gemmatimonadales bacterium]